MMRGVSPCRSEPKRAVSCRHSFVAPPSLLKAPSCTPYPSDGGTDDDATRVGVGADVGDLPPDPAADEAAPAPADGRSGAGAPDVVGRATGGAAPGALPDDSALAATAADGSFEGGPPSEKFSMR